MDLMIWRFDDVLMKRSISTCFIRLPAKCNDFYCQAEAISAAALALTVFERLQ